MALPGELPDGRVPLFLITGFLGSGKTTLLNHLLGQDEMSGTAVLINEFGEVGIDNLLISEIRDELILLKSGCVCCQFLGELSGAIMDLFAKRDAGDIPRFNRLVLETTGLADPMRLVDTVVNHPALSLLVYLDSVIVTVDAVLGAAELAEHPESVKQAALADRLVLTKVDIATPEQEEAVRRELLRLNPAAPVLPTVLGRIGADDVLGAGTLDDGARGAKLKAWLDVREGEGSPHGAVRSFTVRLEGAIAPMRFAPWFSTLVQAEGARLLRVKGLLNTLGDDRPLVVQSVQWVLCPTHRLPAWPDEDRSSRVVFIARELPLEREAEIRRELEAMQRESTAAPAGSEALPPSSTSAPAPKRESFWKRLLRSL